MSQKLSFEEVRDFLLETDAISEAEGILLKNTLKKHANEEKRKQEEAKDQERLKHGLPKEDKLDAMKIADLLSHIEDDLDAASNNTPKDSKGNKRNNNKFKTVDNNPSISNHTTTVLTTLDEKELQSMSLEQFESLAQDELWKLEKLKLSVQRNLEDKRIQHQHVIDIQHEKDFKGSVTSSQWKAKQYLKEVDKSTELQKQLVELSRQHHDKIMIQQRDILSAKYDMELLQSALSEHGSTAATEVVQRLARVKAKTGLHASEDDLATTPSKRSADISKQYLKRDIAMELDHKSRVERILQQVQDDQYIQGKQLEIQQLRNVQQERLRYEQVTPTALDNRTASAKATKPISPVKSQTAAPTVPSSSSVAWNRGLPVPDLLDKFLQEEPSNKIAQTKQTQSTSIGEAINQEGSAASSANDGDIPNDVSVEKKEEASDFLRLPRRREAANEGNRSVDYPAQSSTLNAFRGYPPNQGYPLMQQFPNMAAVQQPQPYGHPAMMAPAGFSQPFPNQQPPMGMFPGNNYPGYIPSGMPGYPNSSNPYQPFQQPAPANLAPPADPVAMQLFKLTQQIEQENMQYQQLQGRPNPFMNNMNGNMAVPALQRGLGMADHMLPVDESPSLAGGVPGQPLQPGLYGLERDKHNQQESRVNREEAKRQEELRKIQHELDKLRCQKELEEFKVDYDKQRITRQKELEYNLWLEDQKRELQAVKMKQILAKEQRLLQLQDMETSNLQGNSNPAPNNTSDNNKAPDAVGPWMRVKEECGVGNQALIALSMTALGLECNVKGVSVVLDAVLSNKSFLSEALAALPDNTKATSTAVVMRSPMIRVALGIYDASGKSVVRLIASEWQPWQEAPANASSWLLQSIQPLLHRSWKFMQSGLNNNDNAGNNNAKFEDIRRSIAGSKCLMELQYKDGNDANMAQKSLGWAVFPLFDPQLISTKASRTAGSTNSSTIVMLSNNTWKVKLRKGLSDPTANPFDESNTTSNESYFLIRIFDSNELLRATAWNVPSSGLKFDDLPMLYQDAFATIASTQELPNLRRSAEKKINSPLPINSPLRPPSSLNKVLQSPAVTNNPAPTPVDPFSVKSLRPSTGLQPAAPAQPALNPVPEDDDDHVLHPPSPRNNNSMFWQLGNVLGPCTERYQRGDGVDIYIDGARFLPDNCTATRISMRLFTSNKEQVGSVYEGMASASSSCISPTFKMKAECRSTVFNATTTALIRIDTIDSSNLLPVSVGYVCLKLFATRDRVQPTQGNEGNVFINTGCFQIPIYGGRFNPVGLPLFNEDMLKDMRRIPCASLLVRVYAAPKSSDGISTLSRDEFPKDDWVRLKLDIPAPEYTSGAYSGALCEPNSTESVAFEAKHLVSVTSSSNSITNGLTTMMTGANLSNNVPLTIEAAINQGMQVNKTHTLPAKPNTVQESAMEAWYKSMFPPLDQVRRSIDFTLCVPYSVESGMSLRIKGLYNLPEPGLFSGSSSYVYKVIASLSPPALYYNDPPLYDGLYWTKTHDFEKAVKAPEFLDGFINLTPAEMSFSLYLILDIRMIKVDPPANKKDVSNPSINVEPPSSRKSFWTLLPLSRERCSGQGFRYLQSGFFQLPLIEGSVPTSGEVLKSVNPMREIKKRLASKEKGVAMKLSDGPSLLLYAHNPLLQSLVLPDMEHPAALPDNAVLQALVDSASDGTSGSGLRLERFQYVAPRPNAVGNTTVKASKTLGQSLPKGVDPKELTRLLNSAFQNATGLPSTT